MNYSDLLNLSSAQKFLNDHRDIIFGKKIAAKLIDIKRSKTYNPEAFNLLYKLEINNKEKLIRISTSLTLDKKHTYELMNYLYKRGADQDMLLIPKPLAYIKDKNILIYENVNGNILKNLINEKFELLDNRIIKCSKILNKIHSTTPPEFSLFDTDMFFKNFNYKSLTTSFPLFKNKIEKIIELIKTKLNSNKGNVLCHGDFNPNNIIFNNESIYLMDFDLSCIFSKEIDLASFLAHLKLMLNQINRNEDFDYLKNSFLKNYGSYDLEKFDLFSVLINIRLLEIAINYTESGYDSSYLYSILSEDLKRINLLNET